MQTNKISKFKKIFSKNWLLITIVIIAAILRLVNLATNPPSLTPDEAALGYNAYSILKTGKNEYGQFLPIVFKSFGDYKPGLYVYTALPSIAILGLSEFSVRLPSALFGIISVILVYLIIKRIFNNKILALLASFLLAISPWHIYFSRGAWEINLSLMLTLFGIYYFYKSLEKNKYLIFSSAFFASTLLAYQGAKLSSGIVIAILTILYFKDLFKKKNLKVVFISVILGLIIALPIILSVAGGQASRLNVYSVFSYPRPEKYLQDFLDQGGEIKNSLSYYLFHSESVNFLRGILGRYFNHFSVRFLFFEGDWANPRHSAPNHGVLLLLDSVLLVFGIIALARRKVNREILFILLWLILSPLPSVLSRDQVHAVRAFNMVIPLVVIMAFGVSYIINNYRKISILLVGIYLLNYIYFLDAYFVHLPIHNSQLWQYGYKQMVEVIWPIKNNYKTVKVQQSYEQPYIYFLFFAKYDPATYQKSAHLKESLYGDVGQIEKLDNICFCEIDWPAQRGEKGNLFVASPIKIPPQDSSDPREFKLIKEINYLDNKSAFRVVEVK